MKVKLIPLLITLLVSFLLPNEVFSQVTYADIEESDQVKQNDSIQKRGTLLRLGFSHMPTQLSEASIVADIPGLPFIDADLPSSNVSNGIQFGMQYLLTENWFAGLDITYIFSSKQENSKRNTIGYVGLVGGYMMPIQHWNRDHLFSFDLGLGVQIVNRPIERIDGYRVSLTRMDYVISPGIRYEFNVFKEKVYLYTQIRYHHQFAEQGSRRGLKFERSREDFIEIISLNDPDIVASPGARIEIGNAIEYSFGVRVNF